MAPAVELIDHEPAKPPEKPERLKAKRESTGSAPWKFAFEPEPIPIMVPFQPAPEFHPDGEPLMSMVILEVELAETVVFVVETRSQPVPAVELAFEKFQM